MGPESTLRSRILVELRKAHPLVHIWGWPASVFTGRGHPDLFGVVKGRFLALELKTRTGRATRMQKQAIVDIRKAGGYAWIVRSVPQATMAVAWALEGKHPPMATDPLDIEDWFKELDQPSPIGEPPVEEEHVFNFEPLSSPFTEEHHAAAERVMGHEPVESLPAFTPQQAEEELEGTLRTIGDRITLCYEAINRIEAVVLKLLALVLEEEPTPEPEPPKRRRRRTQFTVIDEPASGSTDGPSQTSS